ncbi:flavin reductase family protein [Streptomyces sp. NPDC047928]|uniref:flavin reductase family protein n=1 Tax=unclassified Streptomyces TaxID=2593676 RepID=UPI0037173B41
MASPGPPDGLHDFDDPDTLRGVLGRFTTGVTVVTAMTPHGPVGMTANSFSSVSLDPPLVLFSVARRSQLSDHLTRADAFAVNILNAGQRELSARFARPGLNRFGDTDWRLGTTGSPVLPGALGVVECRPSEVHAGGDHLITVGRVVEAYANEPADEPLLFFRGAYRELDRPGPPGTRHDRP